MKTNRLMMILAAVFVIFNFTARAQTGETILSAEGQGFQYDNKEIKASVDRIAELIKKNNVVIYKLRTDNVYHQWGSEKHIFVLEDRFEIRKGGENYTFYYRDIINKKISFSYSGNPENVRGVYFVGFHIVPKGEGNGKKFLDELYLMRDIDLKLNMEAQKSRLILFDPVAAQYRALKVKPPVSEEQRKYIIQANLFNEKKNYAQAIELYKKAIEIDQTAYPDAYSNLALLSAQIKKFNDAIFYMNMYLLLEPEAPDARGARDKIYEWEAEVAR